MTARTTQNSAEMNQIDVQFPPSFRVASPLLVLLLPYF
jgi:hypothetical protein